MSFCLWRSLCFEMGSCMKLTQMIDSIIGICFLISVLVGYYRGLIVTIARIVAMVASYLGAVLAAEALKGVIARLVFLPLLNRQLEGSLFAGIAGEALLEIAQGIAYSVVFFVVFALLEFILFRVVHALKLIDHVPVLGRLNRLGGAVLGFFWVFLLCLLLGNVFFTYVPKELQHQWGFTKTEVQNTVLLNVFVP